MPRTLMHVTGDTVDDIQDARAIGGTPTSVREMLRQTNASRGTNYDMAIVNSEYPVIAGRAPASATSDGYVIVYDRNRVTPIGQPTFYQPEQFLQGLAQARPPVQLQFQINGADPATTFSFFTWHAEPQQALAQNYLATFDRLMDAAGGHWVLAGDLNVQTAGLRGAMPDLPDNQELHHYDNSLDYIAADAPVRNFIRDDNTAGMQLWWRQLLSDAIHYALLAQVNFPKGRRG